MNQYFPDWRGQSTTRNVGQRKPPDANDWAQLVIEFTACQEWIKAGDRSPTRLDEIDAEIQDLQNQFAASVSSINASIATAVSLMPSALTQFQATIDSHYSSIQANSTAITALQGTTTTNGSNISTLQTTVTANSTLLVAHTTSITSLQNTVTSHGATLASHQTNLDQLNGTLSGSVQATSDSALIAGQPVYIKSTGHCDKAQANAVGTAEALGLVTDPVILGGIANICTGESLTLTVIQWNAVTGSLTGLTPGSVYYVSNTVAGMLSTTKPTRAKAVGLAVTPTRLVLYKAPWA